MILMGDMPFRVAFKNFTQDRRKCQLILILPQLDALARACGRKIV